jgi:hypothetical protein
MLSKRWFYTQTTFENNGAGAELCFQTHKKKKCAEQYALKKSVQRVWITNKEINDAEISNNLEEKHGINKVEGSRVHTLITPY